MRGRTPALLALVLAALMAPSAQAKQACPTIADDAGDTGNIVPVTDDPSDLVAVDVSSSRTSLTARLTVVGQPSDAEPATGRMYEVYLDTGEGSFVLRATLAMDETWFQLMSGTSQQAGEDASAMTWHEVKPLTGRVGPHSVTITASLDRDLPLLGRRVDVFGRTWRVVGGAVPTPQGRDGFITTLDETDHVDFRIGDPGCSGRAT